MLPSNNMKLLLLSPFIDLCLFHHDSLSDVGVEFINARPSLAVLAVRHRRGGARDVPAAADGKKRKFPRWRRGPTCRLENNRNSIHGQSWLVPVEELILGR